MSLVTSLAAAGAQAFDTDTIVSAQTAAALAGLGYAAAIRYVSRGSPNAGDITSAEAMALADAGLALLLVQHAPPSRWTPTTRLGNQYGSAGVYNARAAGYPAGATLAVDLENMRPGCGVPAICDYVNAWARAVAAGGYEPMLYFTADCPLTPEQLYLDLVVRLYWRGLSRDAPQVAVCGPCIQQFAQARQVAGIDLDRDVITPDGLGRLPNWATAPAVG